MVSDTTPPLDAAYEATSRWLAMACTEARLTIAPPPRSRIRGMAYFAIRNWPLRLVSTTVSQSCSR